MCPLRFIITFLAGIGAAVAATGGLARAGEVRGRVVLGEEAAAGVRVDVYGMDGVSGRGSAVSDAEGRFHITALACGRYNLRVRLQGELARQWVADATEHVDVPEEGVATLNIRLVRGARITGRIAVAETGRPLSGVVVWARRTGAGVVAVECYRATSGADGHYSIVVPPDGQYLVGLAAQPPAGALPPSTPWHQIVTAQREAPAIVDFPLPRNDTPPVRGIVTDKRGRPVAGAIVQLRPEYSVVGGLVHVRSDRTGAFEIHVPWPDGAVLSARGDDAAIEAIAVRGGEDLRLELSPAELITLSGTVTDMRGRPIEHATVTLAQAVGGRPTAAGVVSTLRGGEAHETDIHGRFSINVLKGRRYSIMAWAPGYGPAWWGNGQSVDGPLELPTLALRRADSFVAGRVVDRDGAPAAGATVVLGSGLASDLVVTDADGRFRFEHVVGGQPLVVSASYAGRRAARRVEAPAEDVVLVLRNQPGGGPAPGQEAEQPR